MSFPSQHVDIKPAVASELQQLQNDVLWTEKGHFASASTLTGMRLVLGILATVGATAAAATVFADAPTIAGVLALVSALFSGLLTFLKPEERASQHLSSARRLNVLGIDIRQTLTLDVPTLEVAKLRSHVSEIARRKAEIDESAPHISNVSIRWAGRQIGRGDYTFDRPQMKAT